jgi:hypothetical protein
MMVILDSGVLIGDWNKDDAHAGWAGLALAEHDGPYLTTELVLAEVAC